MIFAPLQTSGRPGDHGNLPCKTAGRIKAGGDNLFGLFLRQHRMRFRIGKSKRRPSLRDIAYITGISNGYLSDLETGRRTRPSLRVIRRLADRLHLDYNQLMKMANKGNR